jgi:glycine cleavage system H protein
MDVEGCPLPEDLLYDLENDVWVRLEEGGRILVVGLMAHLLSFAGKVLRVTYRELPPQVRRGQSLGTVETLRYTGPVRVPVDGTLQERNPLLLARPKLLNDDTYDRGWFARVAPQDPAEAPRLLETASAIRARVVEKVRDLRIHCYPAAPDSEIFEIGSECSAVLAHLTEEVARRAPEEVVLLVADDPTLPLEMTRWQDQTGHTVLHWRKEGDLYHYLVRKEAHPHPGRPRSGGS